MDSLFRLNNIDVKFKGITVSHDMTMNKRDGCKNLVEEAKQKKTRMSRGNGYIE